VNATGCARLISDGRPAGAARPGRVDPDRVAALKETAGGS
jgi:hypothetical protein